MFKEIFTYIKDVSNAGILEFAIFSGLIILLSLLITSAALLYIPKNYFISEDKLSYNSGNIGQLILYIIRNIFGVIITAAGVAMLFLPGQGILTILIGIMILDFPGKKSLERKIISRPNVLTKVNDFRIRFKREPLIVEQQ